LHIFVDIRKDSLNVQYTHFPESPMHRTLTLLILLAGCSHAIQTTSGAAFVAPTNGPIDKDIAAIAAIEPNLKFPARIGVARIVNGQLSLPPADEADALARMAETLAQMGSFVQVSPLIASMVDDGGTDVIKDIRRTAARQHLDYVLAYEIGASSSERDTPFALADITLIGGALLPTRNIKVMGQGSAIFLDVRNGYPYGTAQVAEDLSGLARSFGTDRRAAALQDRATLKVFKALVPEVQAMLVALQATPR
jgi:hypothetical protein